MINPKDLKTTTSIFKSGNSLAFKLSKKDKEFLKVDDTTVFEKIVSPDGNEITCRKKEQVRPEVMNYAKQYFEEHQTLMDRLMDI